MGIENPAEIIVARLGGKDVKASRWAHAAWQNMADQLPDPSDFFVIQPSYNTGVDASKGTHDFDACCDFGIFGMSYHEASQFARRWGIANWNRLPSQGPWNEHDHGFPIPPGGGFLDRDGKAWFRLGGGSQTRVGILIPQQNVDYANDALGLAASVGGHDPHSDPQPHPNPQYIFDYAKWLEDQVRPEDLDAIRTIVQNNADRVIKRIDLLGTSTVKAIRGVRQDVANLPDDASKQDVAALLDRKLSPIADNLDALIADQSTP